MKSRKNQEKIVKYLFKNSLSDSSVDESKAQNMIMQLIAQKPPQLINILKIYKKMILRALSREEIVVESATTIDDKNFETMILKKTNTKRIKYKTNPNLVMGMKITHGDWIYDETLQAKLNQLTINS